MELKTHLPGASGGQRAREVVPDPARYHRIEVREEGSRRGILPMTAELLSTCLEAVTRLVSIEDLADEWLVDGVPVDLRQDAAAAGDREQPPQLVAVCGVRVDVRGACPPQGREGRRWNKANPLLCSLSAPAGHQDLF
jgi:hypothetical protein